MSRLNTGLWIIAAALLGGCATTPSTNVYQPMSARPAPPPQAPGGNGAIFQPGYTKMALFEDRRARHVGDTLTVVINEKNTASSSSNKSDSHNGSTSLTANPNFLAGSGSTGTSLFSSTSASKAEDKGQNTNSGAFTGTVTTTVVDVLPNGNLVVSGEKQVSVEHKTEYMRISGVVNPATISASNTVSSTQIADARVEYKGAESLDKAQMMTMLTRFFLSVLF